MHKLINKYFKTHINLKTKKKKNTDDYKIESSFNFSKIKEPYKYIFLRLYDVEYLNHWTPVNFLQFGINCTEIYDFHACHVAVNFNLSDSFYGLTSGGKQQLAKESCTNSKNSKFTKQCDPLTSNQITYAIRVTAKEYENMKVFVESYALGTDIKFDILHDIKIARFATKRKFFTSKENQLFGTVVYPSDKFRNIIKKVIGYGDKENYFVCSSFVAYTLIKNVPRIAKWFEEREINYRYVNVTDVANIPGCVRLFSSKFFQYNKAVREFIKCNPEFEEYVI